MTKKLFNSVFHNITALFVASLVFCSIIDISAQESSKDFDQIKKILLEQQKNWNAGNIDSFMEAYWNSEELQFGGANGITRGWKQTLDQYKKGYPDRTAMGKLTFQIKDMTKHSRKVVSLTGSWDLERGNDNPGGHFLLIWKKFKGKWKIVVDHTSQKMKD